MLVPFATLEDGFSIGVSGFFNARNCENSDSKADCVGAQPNEQRPMKCDVCALCRRVQKIQFYLQLYYGLWIIDGVLQPTSVNERR